jgi:hypothetical protein
MSIHHRKALVFVNPAQTLLVIKSDVGTKGKERNRSDVG